MPKRIAQILGRMDSGGVESVVMNYYRLLDTNEVQFDFYIDKTSSLPQKEEILSKGGRIFYLPSYSNVFGYYRLLKKYLSQEQYTIVHSHLSTLSALPLCAAWRANVPIRIAHSHSTANMYELKKSLLKYLLRPTAKIFATDYFACGEKAGRWLFSNKTFDKGEVFIMENIIDYKKFAFNNECRSQVREEFDIPRDCLVIGHIGRFCKQKNQLYLLDVFSKIVQTTPAAKLLLVGEGDKYLSEVKLKAKKLHLEQSVIFAGVRSDVEKFYSAFDIFLLPSLYEGMPVVSVEAKANRLPMIVSSNVTSEVDQFSLGIKQKNIDSWANMATSNARNNLTN